MSADSECSCRLVVLATTLILLFGDGCGHLGSTLPGREFPRACALAEDHLKPSEKEVQTS